jgi:hypothetical protein
MRRDPIVLLAVVAGLLWAMLAPAVADSAGPSQAGQPAAAADEPGSRTADDRSFGVAGGWRGRLVPGSDLYPGYMADPLRPTLATQYLHVIGSEIPDTGDSRFLHHLGGRFGLLRLFPDARPDAGFQLDIQAAYIGMFDNDNSQDNIGWDGVYGVLLTWARGPEQALKFGMQHDSSHLGDEYVERTGRSRIDYTREEVVLGISRRLVSNLRVYGEGAYGYVLGNPEFQDPWRLQGGFEIEDGDRLWGGRLGWFAAADLTTYEENDWNVNLSIQVGLIVPGKGAAPVLRFGGAYYNGRSILGEFSQFDEETVSLGLWVDF